MRSLPKALTSRISIIEWLPKYTRTDVIADFIAGITVGLTMMPQSIAYAGLAGLPAQYGLYTAFMGSFTYVLFGTIKEVSIGPTSLMAILTYSYVVGKSIEYVILLSFLVGCVELLMGLLRLGFLVDFISPCVTSGFTSATSIIIIGTQLKGLLGVNLHSHDFFKTIIDLCHRLGDVRLGDSILSLCCLVTLYGFKQLSRIKTDNFTVKKTLWLLSISKNALVVVVTALIGYYLELYRGESPFYLSKEVPQGLPEFKLPSFSITSGNETVSFIEMVHDLGSGILVIPVVAILANIAIAKSFAHSKIVDASQEMMTLGLCNVFGSFIQAMPSCGAFTRSAVASNSGVKTPLQGIYSGTIIILALSFLTPYFHYIPKATLSSVLVFAVVSLIDYEIFPKLWKVNKFDFWITVITLVTGLIFGADVGIIVGSVINLIVLLKLWARPHITIEQRFKENGEKYIYLKPELGLYYPGITFLSQEILKVHVKDKHLPLILDCCNILSLDYAGAQVLSNLINTYNKNSIQLMFLNVNQDVSNYVKKVTNVDNLEFCHCEDEPCEKFIKSEDVVLETSQLIESCSLDICDATDHQKVRKMSNHDV